MLASAPCFGAGCFFVQTQKCLSTIRPENECLTQQARGGLNGISRCTAAP
jgi:hypothetical protein